MCCLLKPICHLVAKCENKLERWIRKRTTGKYRWLLSLSAKAATRIVFLSSNSRKMTSNRMRRSAVVLRGITYTHKTAEAVEWTFSVGENDDQLRPVTLSGQTCIAPGRKGRITKSYVRLQQCYCPEWLLGKTSVPIAIRWWWWCWQRLPFECFLVRNRYWLLRWQRERQLSQAKPDLPN